MKVEVEVTNRRAALVTDYDSAVLLPFWSYAHPRWKYVMRSKPMYLKCRYCGKTKSQHDASHTYIPRWDGMIKMMDKNVLSSGLFWATRKEVEAKTGIKFSVIPNLKNVELKTENVVRADGKYAFQNECVDHMLKSLPFGGGLVVNCTGSGKTFLTGAFFSHIKNMVCFVVDQLVLMRQAKSDLESVLGEEVGWIGDSEFQPRRVTVATRQTLYKHWDYSAFKVWSQALQVIVIDEIHEQMNHSNFVVVENIKPKAVFGLTATLQLKKKSVRLKAYSLAGPVLFTYPLSQGQEEGVLSKGVAVRVMYPNRITSKQQKNSGWSELYNQQIVGNGERNHLITNLIQEAYNRGKYAIVLVTRVRHLKELSDRLKIPHRIVSGTFNGKEVTVTDRLLSKGKFEAGKIRVIIANAVFKKGVDIKRVDCIIDAAAGRNENDPLQKFGRGVRRHEEKAGLLYFDINDWDRFHEENYFWKASRYRARALKAAGVKLARFVWEEDGEAADLMDFAESLLQKELEA